MYSDFLNQLLKISHYIAAFMFLFFLCPRILFSYEKDSVSGMFFQGYIRMVLLVIVIGYLLVSTLLFELISITGVLLIITAYKYILVKPYKKRLLVFHKANVLVYNYIDGIVHPEKKLRTNINNLKKRVRLIIKRIFGNYFNIAMIILVSSVFIFSIYLRFYDAVSHAAPPLSDAYITLDWVKHINKRILFYEPGGGIYPRGFHIYMATIQKFASIDPLYILRYSGPLNGVLIAFGLYFAISGFTGSRSGGLVAAFVYGTLGMYLTIEWERQASTNSQEFALIFILPALYFFYMYMRYSKRNYLWTAAAGTCVTGLVHTIAFAFTGLGMGLIILTALVSDYKKYIRKILWICLTGIISVVISLVPIGMGLITGNSLHSSSLEYLTSQSKIECPKLMLFDKIALCCLALLLLYIIIAVIKKNINSSRLFALKFIFVLGLTGFILYYWAGPMTQSTMLSNRSPELWALMTACLTGTGWHLIQKFFTILFNKHIAIILLVFILTAGIFYFNPKPPFPYKMQHESTINQYLRISNNFKTKTWWLVDSSKEAYAIIQGEGFHVYTDNFLSTYKPDGEPLTKYGSSIPDETLPQDIFIYYEKNIFRVSRENSIYPLEEPHYSRREKERRELKEWIDKYQSAHDNICIFYEDKNLRVYHIHISKTKKEIFERIWSRILLFPVTSQKEIML